MLPGEIVLPITEPETEWVRGRPLQKMSPTRSHGRLQLAIGRALDRWAAGKGEVATEWRFRIAPPGERVRPLVPDVAYVAAARLAGLTAAELESPRFSPDAVVEILSPGDRRVDVDDKIGTYLRAGSLLVIVIDPMTKTVELHDAAGATVLRGNDDLVHAVLPGFTLPLPRLFGVLEPKFRARRSR